MNQSDDKKKGMLYMVATPIGNLEDITIRALRVLKEVDLIAAEDTRHSRILLSAYDIRTPLVSLHETPRRTWLPVHNPPTPQVTSYPTGSAPSVYRFCSTWRPLRPRVVDLDTQQPRILHQRVVHRVPI